MPDWITQMQYQNYFTLLKQVATMFWKDPGMFYKSQGTRVYVGGIGYLQPGQMSLSQIPEIENE